MSATTNRWLLALVVAAGWLCADATETLAEPGSIAGTVRFAGKAPAPRQLKVDKDVEVCAQHALHSEELLVSESGGVQNAFVQVVGAEGTLVVPKGADRLSLTQKGCRFLPHLQVIPAGARMDIVNEDGIAHNIHTLSVENPSFNQQQPGAKKRMVTQKTDFTMPEIIPVKCDIHGWMKAWLAVVDHPFYAVSDGAGGFRIEGIPEGKHTVEVWHETLGRQTREVEVKAGTATPVEVVFEPEG